MLKFFNKIILPSFLAVLLFILTLFFIVIPVFENAMMDRKREMIQELTNSASSILEKYYKDEVEGMISKEDAQQTAISRIQYLRYGDENKDYFWITDMHPNMIMHPYVPELNGTDLSDYEDSHGKKLFVEFVSIVKEQGQGFVDYMWQWKDDSTHVVPKLSYVKKFEPWGWIIGTGIYIEDVRKEISALSSKLMYISIIIAAITALLLTFISFQSLRIERKRQSAESNLKESREKYRSLVEASTEGLVMISDNRIIFANPVFLKLSGLAWDELESMNWQDIFILPVQLNEKLTHGNHDIETEPFETDISLPVNRKIHALIHLTPILFYGKKAVIFSIKDISTDIIMKRELFESRERFKTLMDKLNVGIFRTTMDARGRFVEANHTALQLLGYNDNEHFKEKYILDLFAEKEDKKQFRNDLLNKGFIRNKVIKLKKTDGEIAHMMVSLAVITGEDGQATYCDGIIEPFSSKITAKQFTQKIINTNELRTLIHSIGVHTFIKPLQTIRLDQPIGEATLLMDDLQNRVLFVSDNQSRILGFVTDTEIATGLTTSGLKKNSPVFNIMRSPLISVKENTSVITAKSILRKRSYPALTVSGYDENIVGYIHTNDLNAIDEIRMSEIFEEIGKALSIENLTQLRFEFVTIIAKLTENKLPSNVILQLLSEVFDSITSRLFDLAYVELGTPPVEFAFVVMGSEGRLEQTLKTDQDNAMIYRDTETDMESHSKYFLNLGTWINNALHYIGYALCKGENMSMNPQWNKPLSDWKNYFYKWINSGQPKDLLDINIFFDLRFCYGTPAIVEELESHILSESKSNTAFLHHLAKNAMHFKPSVNLFGNVIVESAGAPADTLRIKDNIAAIVNFTRIYALQQGITNKNTILRLRELNIKGVLNDSELTETVRVFEYLTSIRIQHQASLILENKEADNIIHVKTLTGFEQTMIKKSLSIINDMLSKLNFDFKLNL